MDLDSESTATSIDENTENFCENPTRDTLAEGLMGLIKPTVDQLDERVRATRISQLELKQCIESLSDELKKISESQQTTIDLDVYVKKLINAKQRVTVLSNILQNAQDRLNKVHMSIDKEVVKRKVILNDVIGDPVAEVYEPSEDTFLLLDALEADAQFLLDLNPKMAVEVGSGSGVIITGLACLLKEACVYFSTDINLQACHATKDTAELNMVPIDCINMDLLLGFKNNIFDIILFNPPYVVTESEEISGSGLSRAWAGGTNGRKITDKLLCNISDMLTDKGVCYVVLLKENNPEEVINFMKNLKFDSQLVLRRKIPGELLYIYKFFRIK